MAYVTLALRVMLGALLAVAGVLKALDGPARTVAFVAGYRILPEALARPLGVALPYVEIFLGAYLVVGLFTRVSAWVASAQFVVFAIAVGSLVVRGIAADCGCFGSAVPTPPSWAHVAIDLALAFVSAFVARRAPGPYAVDCFLQGGPAARGHEA
ncbi:MAG: hypothetical protein NVS4B5_06830 [Vulcanimicrobiaceae bacterium]